MTNLPIACQTTALDAGQRERRAQIVEKLLSAADKVNELENGYSFRYPLEDLTWIEVAEFVDLERQCCPFFAFEIQLTPESRFVWLRLTGENGAKEFLRNHEDFPTEI